ncbi:MAG: glycosyltransferase family 2 protein [Candidatus Helarchaeota archaeon]|nr:glycosyltransferase family 2 protein [Candidatus Helarchaeota archaeon]
MSPEVFIILVNWNNYKDTKDCIESLLKIDYDNYNILVVDNGSEDDSYKKLYEEFSSSVSFIKNNENLGFSGGNNVGIKYALKKGCDYVLLLNNDTIVDRLFLSELMTNMEKDSRIVVSGSKVYYYSDANIIWFGGGKFNFFKSGTSVYGLNKNDTTKNENVKEVDYISGCALLVRSNIFSKIGLLDENFFNYGEDADFCLRAKRAGCKVVFVPSSKVWHKVASTMKGNFSPFYLYFQSKNRLLLVKKNFPKIYLIYAIFIHIFCYIPYKLFIVWLKKEKKLKASLSLFLGTYDFLMRNKSPRFFDRL